ncbi:3-oxoacyl-[acyl-carrier protein] reductase [Algibacter lectus]|uniref:3-oxoacyl-[acyl-carrier protein] reductase n=1 Tax=Algibacter lectus TaxID=221126 RepID=A0A090X2I8_9FLAO|nr:SDR family oxidoreductase [Algibacter lectus]GAL82664.1 3-oxoacyl-[acyl-carrier protein] reductase [Algibacter lectus]
MSSLKGKIAIVTGSSRGIGAEIAKALGKNGAKIIINYTVNKDSAESVVNQIIQNGSEAISIQADVSLQKDVSRLFDETISHFGKIDVLVNNAGVMLNSLIKDTTDDLFDKQMNINVKGVFYTLREASTKLADNGSIINLSSTVTRTIFPTYGIYSASKIAIEQMSKVFAKEIGNRGINVNCVLPGPTSTELFLKGKSEELIAQLANNNAFKRLGTPSDIAKVVAFLASDEAKWISAQNIGANGAMA